MAGPQARPQPGRPIIPLSSPRRPGKAGKGNRTTKAVTTHMLRSKHRPLTATLLRRVACVCHLSGEGVSAEEPTSIGARGTTAHFCVPESLAGTGGRGKGGRLGNASCGQVQTAHAGLRQASIHCRAQKPEASVPLASDLFLPLQEIWTVTITRCSPNSGKMGSLFTLTMPEGK